MIGGSVGLILVAAGYGSVRTYQGTPVPKVLEDIGGVPMFLRVMMAAEQALIERMVVVVNPTNEHFIRNAVQQALCVGAVCTRPTFVIQHERRGSADAVMRSLPHMQDYCVDKVMVAYGDMPLWSAETMLNVLAHSEKSDITMVTARRQRALRALDRYGRVIHDTSGMIRRIVEVENAAPHEKSLAVVNPSLWTWPVSWLCEHIPRVPSCERADAFGPEIYLPPLVDMAYHECTISEVLLPEKRAYEALGVNTALELKKARSFFA